MPAEAAHSKNHFRFLIIMAFIIVCHLSGQAQFNANASVALINRVIPDQSSHFIIEELQTKGKADVFEIESRNDQIILRGTSSVAIASALYYYLTHFCHCQITWNGTNLHIPNP